MGIMIGIRDVIDILLVAFILYEVFRLLRRSGVVNLFWGIFAFIATWFLVTYVFKLELTGALFDRIISVGAIALIIIFQEEIRSFFYRVGSQFSQLPLRRKQMSNNKEQVADQIALACKHMSESKTGALIVITASQELTEYTDTGEYLDAATSARMIENIFFKNTPLHDGALFIHKGRLHSAACILPVSKNSNLPKQYGLRHRAALGLTEKTDATTIVVSEETGQLSLAKNGEIHTITLEELSTALAGCTLA